MSGPPLEQYQSFANYAVVTVSEELEVKMRVARRTFPRNPGMIIRRGCGTDGDPVDLHFLMVLTTDVVQFRDYRTTSLVDSFMKMIVNGFEILDPSDYWAQAGRETALEYQGFGGGSCTWEIPLNGVSCALAAINEEQARPGPHDAEIVQHLKSNYKDMARAFRKDFPKLLPVGDFPNHLRRLVMSFFTELATRHGMLE